MSDPAENRTTTDEYREQQAKIERLRSLLRSLAEAVLEDVRSCDSVVSIDTENQARIVIEEILA